MRHIEKSHRSITAMSRPWFGSRRRSNKPEFNSSRVRWAVSAFGWQKERKGDDSGICLHEEQASSVPEPGAGVGPALATALVATVADPKAFRSGRAWIGLVPKQRSSGGRQQRLQARKPSDCAPVAAAPIPVRAASCGIGRTPICSFQHRLATRHTYARRECSTISSCE
jgi:Transposase IS116/IS110/IS902 family